MATSSAFIVSSREAAEMALKPAANDDAHVACFLLNIQLLPIYGEKTVPHGVFKKLPRLVNGIPLVPGRFPSMSADDILWKYVDGCTEVHMFVSQPITRETAEKTRINLINTLVKNGKAIFGEVAVKASITLSMNIAYDSGLLVNDITDPLDQQMHFD